VGKDKRVNGRTFSQRQNYYSPVFVSLTCCQCVLLVINFYSAQRFLCMKFVGTNFWWH
jgi:hypothetical protein